MKLSIIIVNYNVTDLLRNCLASVIRYTPEVTYEIIVIDNNSPDTSWRNLQAQFPTVHFIASPQNNGFAIANNTAAKGASGEYILLLNPDTLFTKDILKEIIDFADLHSDLGCLGVRMVDAQGRFLPESKRAVPDVINSFEKLFINFKKNTAKSYYRKDISEFDVARVEVITGAFLLMKRKLFLEEGGLDEKYFMYGEDIDLCYTLLRRNCVNWYYGSASIVHYKGESTVKDAQYIDRFYGAMKIFVDKYYRSQKPLQYLILNFGLQIKRALELRKLKKGT